MGGGGRDDLVPVVGGGGHVGVASVVTPAEFGGGRAVVVIEADLNLLGIGSSLE